ncbi:uncharacterized protein [Clytia hemisphaerica]
MINGGVINNILALYFFINVIQYGEPEMLRRVDVSTVNNKVEYGYVSMVTHDNHILNVTAINISYHKTSQECIRTCLNFTNCGSINLKKQQNNEIYECHILDTDRFRNASNFVSSSTGNSHFSLDHDCEWKETCINPNKICIPNYSDGSYECVCEPIGKYDIHCINRNIAFQRPVTLSRLDPTSGKPAFVTDGYKGEICNDFSTNLVHSKMGTMEIWLRIDLGGMKQIKFIDIFDRTIGAPHHQRLAFTDIIVYGQNPIDNRQLCSTITLQDTENGDKVFKVCNEVLTGSGVELYKAPGTWQMIHLCEIAVYGPTN